MKYKNISIGFLVIPALLCVGLVLNQSIGDKTSIDFYRFITILFLLLFVSLIFAVLYNGEQTRRMKKAIIDKNYIDEDEIEEDEDEENKEDDEVEKSTAEIIELVSKYSPTLYTKEELTAFRKEGLKLYLATKMASGYQFLFKETEPNSTCECEFFHSNKLMSEEETQKKEEEGWKCIFEVKETNSDNVYSYFEKEI